MRFWKKKKKKPVEEICGNCRLFNGDKRICKVVVLYAGERINIPVDPQDKCFYQNKFTAIHPVDKDIKEDFNVDIQEVKFWMEDPVTGEKLGENSKKKGVVKMEYPEGFFGPETKPEDLLDI